jgi:hypothetical protein
MWFLANLFDLCGVTMVDTNIGLLYTWSPSRSPLIIIHVFSRIALNENKKRGGKLRCPALAMGEYLMLVVS